MERRAGHRGDRACRWWAKLLGNAIAWGVGDALAGHGHSAPHRLRRPTHGGTVFSVKVARIEPALGRRGIVTRSRGVLCAVVASVCLAAISGAETPAVRQPDVRYEPTPMDVVDAMLRLANVSARDVVYDLGCGDGRIVIAAARQFGARGICVDIDHQRIAESRDNARQAGVTERITFLNEDLFATRLGPATVVMLFLSPELNRAVRPKLLRELTPGTRIVSHWHDMGDWTPQETVKVRSGGRERPIHLWIVPAR